METEIFIKQTLKKTLEDSYLLAEVLYDDLSDEFKSHNKRVQLVAFTAVGNITYGNVRLRFL
jgi:hypothetical protein